MTVRDEIKALIDKLPKSRLRIAKACLLQGEFEDRFRKEFLKKRSTPVGGSEWSGVCNGFHVAGRSVHRVKKNNELIVQTLYSYDGHKVEISEKFSLAARKTKLLCRLVVSSGGVTFQHGDQFPLLLRKSESQKVGSP